MATLEDKFETAREAHEKGDLEKSRQAHDEYLKSSREDKMKNEPHQG